MILRRIRLRGATGLRAYGEEIEVNFDSFDPGTIALVGPNGAGKTTFLENLQPWPTLISRNGSLAKHFYLRDSIKELEFEYGGHTYLCKTLIDGEKKKVESYLYRDGEPLNDGKMPGYKKIADELFGSPAIFFKAIFKSQNGEQISKLTGGDKKEFFIALLGHDRYNRLVEKSKENRGQAEIQYSEIAGKIDQLNSTIATAKEKLQQRATIESEIEQHQQSIFVTEGILEDRKSKLADAEGRQEARKQTVIRIADIHTEVKTLDSEKETLETQKKAALDKIEAEITAIENGISDIETKLTKAESIRKDAQYYDHILSERAKLDETRSKVLELKKQKESLQSAVDAEKARVRSELDKLEIRSNSLDDKIKAERKAQESKVESIRTELKTAEKAATLLDTVPCKDTTEFVSTCGLINNAREAKDRIGKLTGELEQAEAELDIPLPLEAELDSVRESIEKTKAQQKAPLPGEDEINTLEIDIGTLGFDAGRYVNLGEQIAELSKTDWSAAIAELDKAETTIEERRRQIESQRKQLEEATKDYLDRIGTIGGKQDEKRSAIRALESEIGEDPGPEIADLSANVKANEEELSKYRTSHGEARGRLESLNQLQVENEENMTRQSELVTEKDSIAKDLTDWKFLETAFGKNGIQALELEEAGPQISSIATEILQEFGREWAIAIRTVRASADGKKEIETFDIMVSTPAGPRNFDDLSCGEQVWVEESLRKAVMIYLINHSGRDYRTIMQDEADGPLDPDRARAFLDTTFKAHELTGAHHTIIISQRPEIWEQVPQRIHLDPEKGTVEIVR